ncbi:hypothetical protein [Sporosarcina limicola]|uniref:Uncharacterized protein n=1 Tax=Sporosarcina limicola TaxID=34101 RepID=A0A927R3W4_9BACL|nr:hypothetical protein [Sporosarcina limicola]MBE1555526.1 hypothetical protein [Sporosarcina limicola]
MEIFLYFGAVVLITMSISLGAKLIYRVMGRKYFYSKKLTAPPYADLETKRLFQQFNRAWSGKFEKTVNERMKQVKRNLTNSELRERWYELKKFLFLAGISKGLPMFSREVDELWHFFLEEKELYNGFCIDFIGEQIKHHPHETPKHLPNERAWFDLLYLSFFNVTSHTYLWGEFIQNKKEHAKWTAHILNDSEGICKSFGRHSSNAASVLTLTAFLKFARKQLMQTDGIQANRVQRSDGYWYGTALFSLYGCNIVYEEIKKEYSTTYSDGSGSFATTSYQDEEWKEIITDVNGFEVGTDAGTSSGGGDSDSGSSCSSCSGCSS